MKLAKKSEAGAWTIYEMDCKCSVKVTKTKVPVDWRACAVHESEDTRAVKEELWAALQEGEGYLRCPWCMGWRKAGEGCSECIIKRWKANR